MPAGQFVKVVIPLYYEGHAYRAGSRIRVTIAAPNGTQPIWSFGQTEPSGHRRRCRSRSRTTMPSSLVLPVVPGVNVPTRAAGVPEPAQRAVPAVLGAGQSDTAQLNPGTQQLGAGVRSVAGQTGRTIGGRGGWVKSKSAVEVAEDRAVLADVGPRVGPTVGGRIEPLPAEEVVLDELVVRVVAERLVSRS